MRSLVLFMLFLVVNAKVSFAAQVLEVGKDGTSVAVEHDGKETFHLDDYVCIFHSGQQMACGTVVKANDKGAVFQVDFKKEKLHPGDKVVVNRHPRHPASVDESRATAKGYHGTPSVFLNLSAGAAASPSYLLPLVHLQFLVAPYLSFGLEPTYVYQSDTGTKLKAFGGLLTANFCHLGSFLGIWVQAAGGAFFFNVSSSAGEESVTSYGGRGLIGYRVELSPRFNLGAGVGAQYISAPKTQSIAFEYSPVQPVALIDLGFSL